MRRLGEPLPLAVWAHLSMYGSTLAPLASPRPRAHRPGAFPSAQNGHLYSYSPLLLYGKSTSSSTSLPLQRVANPSITIANESGSAFKSCYTIFKLSLRQSLAHLLPAQTSKHVTYEDLFLGRNIIDLVWPSDPYHTMLLPSALPCEAFSRSSPASCLQLLPSPPCDTATSTRVTKNIQTTCHALQSLLTTSSSAYSRFPITSRPRARRLHPSETQRPLLESPIAMISSASDPPSRISFRMQPSFSEKPNTEDFNALYPSPPRESSGPRPPLIRRPAAIRTSALRNRPSQSPSRARGPVLQNPIDILSISKEPTTPRSPVRGKNKRRRSSVNEAYSTTDCSGGASTPPTHLNFQPSTPKRRRLLPLPLPRGLVREDFDALQLPSSLTDSKPDRQSHISSFPSLYSCYSASRPLSPTPPSPEIISSSSDEDLDALFWFDTDLVLGGTDSRSYLLSLILQKLRLRQYDKREMVGTSKRALPATGGGKMWV